MDANALADAAQVAERACDLAQQEIMPRFRSVAVEWKTDGSPVTEADRAAERVIRKTLREAYPEHGLIGEEYGDADAGPDDAPRWIIDPIDGTISFSRGIPLFGTLLALTVGGETVVGVIDLPAIGERYVGVRGGGCRRNGTPVHCSESSDLRRSIVGTGDPICFDFAERRPVLDRILREVPLVRGYTDAFGHAQTIAGGLDAMVDCDLNAWDAAATQLLAVEAGGACETLTGARGKIDLVFGSKALVEQLLEMF